MSYITCLVASCKTRRKPRTDKNYAIKCFSFPKDPILKKEWFDLCQVKESDAVRDCHRKVCIKHFKEDDFVDGLKARLLNIQPTRLKKHAVPSLYLNDESDKEDHTKETDIKKQEKISEKLVDETIKQETKISKTSDNVGSSVDYLSKLIPIAPKAPTPSYMSKVMPIAPKVTPQVAQQPVTTGKRPKAFQRPTLRRKIFKLSEQPNTTTKPKEKVTSPEEVIILKSENEMYEKRINMLINNQNLLIARIKNLEETIKNKEEEFVTKAKQAFAHVLTPNQVDVILGTKKPVHWTDVEYFKAYSLQQLSDKAYHYVRNTMNYPLPDCTVLQRWTDKMDIHIYVNNDDEIRPPLTKRLRLKFGELEKENVSIIHVSKRPKDVIKPYDDLPNDYNTSNYVQHICDVKPEPKNENINIDQGLDVNKQSDDEYNIAIDNNNDNDDEIYEEIDYIDDINVEFIDDVDFHDNTNKCNKDVDDFDDHENEIDKSYEFYEKLIIENLNRGVIRNLNHDKIEKDNG